MNFESIAKYGDHFYPEDITGKEMFIAHYACGVADGKRQKKFYGDMPEVYDKHPGVYIREGR